MLINQLKASTSTPVIVKKESDLLRLLDFGSSPIGFSKGSSSSPFGTPKQFGSSATPASSSRPTVPLKRSSLTRVSGTGTPLIKPEPTEPIVKPESTEPIIPRKRLSDVAFSSSSFVKKEEPVETFTTPKKLKTGPLPKTPLALVNANTSASHKALAPPPPPVDIPAIREQIASIGGTISHFQNLLDNAQRKRTKSKAAIRNIAAYANTLDRLRRQKQELTASIPSSSLIKHSPTKASFSVKSDPSLPAPPPFYHPAFDGKPIMQQQPIASGSKAPARALLSYRVPGAYDSDDDMNVDPSAAVLQSVVQKGAIPNIAPIANADNFDANGDFFGRGRDMFVGPQAKADEYVSPPFSLPSIFG